MRASTGDDRTSSQYGTNAPTGDEFQFPRYSLPAPTGNSSRSETSAEVRRLQNTVGTFQMQIEAQTHRRARANLELNLSLVTLQTRTQAIEDRMLCKEEYLRERQELCDQT